MVSSNKEFHYCRNNFTLIVASALGRLSAFKSHSISTGDAHCFVVTSIGVSISHLQKLRSLDLRHVTLTTDERTALSKCISQCKSLTRFGFQGPGVAEIICSLSARLECLKCQGCNDVRLAATHIATLTVLQVLQFSGLQLEPECLVSLQTHCSIFTRLRVLHISGTRTSTKGTEGLAIFVACLHDL